MRNMVEKRTVAVTKRGVSLVTVLLFMLVATIAATATFKWLTSENRSSGARLLKQEAFQSAMAGIENARAWMTYNANDVGALIKQYQDSGKKIKLNSRLTPWMQANQEYDVWLTGVNTGSAHNFKLKILSSGKSSKNTVHNEIAIFNVDGLYQVQIPQETHALNYDKAFDGILPGVTGSDTLQSGIIHGDFRDQNNTPKLTGNFVVAGNMGFGGTVHGDGDMYIKGSLTTTNGGYTFGTPRSAPHEDTNVVYIGGDVDCASNSAIKVYGDLHVDGTIRGNCAIDVSGNLTVGHKIVRNSSGTRKFTVKRNLVFKETGELEWTNQANISLGTGASDADEAGTGVGGNSYLASVSGKDESGNRKINLGRWIYLYQDFPSTVKFCQNSCNNAGTENRTKSDLTCGKNGDGGRCPSGYCEGFFSTCHQDGTVNIGDKGNRYFSFYSPEDAGRVKSDAANRIHSWVKTDNVLKNVSHNYWKNIEKMRAYGQIIKDDGTIPQAILLTDTAKWKKSLANTFCDIPVNFIMDSVTVDSLNSCYTKATNSGKLYNGFLVIEWKYNQHGGELRGHKLHGNFVIYASTAVGNTFLPATTENSVVMFYFERGANGQLLGQHDKSGYTDDVYNYFIYSAEDMKELHGFNIRGSIVMATGKELKKVQGNNRIEYKGEVLNALATAGFIKENPEFTSLAMGSSSSTGQLSNEANADDYYIANSPQLHITLESQYENNEPLPAAGDQEDLAASFIVLPRVIILPKDPYGRLGDYFNVVNLNGSAVVKNVSNVGGCTGIPKNPNLLYNRTAAHPTVLPAGLHECNYQVGGKSVPFYIFVTTNQIGSAPRVKFLKDEQPMGSNSTESVQLVYPKQTPATAFKVKVRKPNNLPADNSWEVIPIATTQGTCDDASPECTFTLSFDAGSPKELFRVKTHNADAGTLAFQIVDCEGCQIDVPYTETFNLASSVTIERRGLSEYCTKVSCSEEYANMADPSWPDCVTDKAWVKAVGFNASTTNNCSAEEPLNGKWKCGVSSDIKLQEVPGNVPAGCVAVIPQTDENVVPKTSLTAGEEYPLYAQLKASKVTFHVGFAGSQLTGKEVVVSSNRFATDQVCVYSDGGCTYNLFAGDEITLTIPSTENNFSYWKCNPSTSVNCTSEEPFTGKVYTFNSVSGNNSVVAWFNQKDKHCFFDEFGTDKLCTGQGDDWKYCFDYCSSSELCAIGEGVFDGLAKWLILGDSDLRNKLEYSGGKIWLAKSYNRGKKQSDVTPLVALSTVDAGLYGMLRAQFQVPRLGVGDDESSSKVTKSGFLLRSNDDATNYLILNIFADKNGDLSAKACVVNSCSEVKPLHRVGGRTTVSSTSIVTLSATIESRAGKDHLKVDVVTGNYGDFKTSSTDFDLDHIAGYSSLAGNNRVGISLADPDFKIYDVGWKSEDYNAQCWDTPPTVKCSFKAAFMGGIVPLEKDVKPWVGLSSWYDKRGCSPQFWYKGDDACTKDEDDYGECYSGVYNFQEEGQHGIEATESRMAKVVVQNCISYITDAEMELMYAEQGKCGPFWVGDINNCQENRSVFKDASRTIPPHSGLLTAETYSETELFALSNVNLRAANLQVLLQNEGQNELEIYLRSETSTGYYGGGKISYSTPVAYSGNTGTLISFNISEMSNVEGFDPEHVTGIIIRNLGASNVTVTEVKVDCPFAPSLSCEDAKFEAQKFNVKVTAKNTKDVSSYSLTGKKNSSTETAFNLDFNCLTDHCPETDAADKLVFRTPGGTEEYNPYSTAGSNTFEFTVHMKTKVNGVEKEVEGSPCTASVIISGITAGCKWNDNSQTFSIAEENGFPPYRYSLSGCPSGECPFRVVLDNNTTPLYTGNGNTSGYVQLPSTATNSVNTAAHPLSVGQHTIRIESTNTSTAFESCTKTFNVTKKPAAALKLTCGFTNQTNKLVGETLSTAGSVTATGCGDGETCTWTITEGTSTTALGSGTFGSTPYNFTGASEAGTHTYSFNVTRSSDNAKKSCTFTVDYPLNLSCGTFADPGPVSAGTSITPASPTVTSGTVSGCNGKCSYAVTGGHSVSGGRGSNSNGTTVSSFTDTGVSGATDYTYTVSLVEGTTVKASKSCPFTVTYAASCATITQNITGTNSTITGRLANGCAIINTNRICTGEMQIELQPCNGKRGSWNGKSFTLSNSNNGYWSGTNPSPSTTNRLDMPDCPTATINKVYLNDCVEVGAVTNPPVIKSCPTNKLTRSPNANVKIPVTIENCMVEGGCKYTISTDGVAGSEKTYYQGSISFAGESSGEHAYVLRISNAKGSATCSFSVEYKEGNLVTIAKGSTKSVKCGERISTNFTCSSNCAALRCTGSFYKSFNSTVSGFREAGQYNELNYITGYSSSAQINDIFTTDCDEGNTMSCKADCGC